MRFTTKYGWFELNQFPGASQICVLNACTIAPEFRGQGHGREHAEEIVEKARELGFDFAIMTVVSTNEPQLKTSKHAGYSELARFSNRMTGNDNVVLGRSLQGSTVVTEIEEFLLEEAP